MSPRFFSQSFEPDTSSPFHGGEQRIQHRLGVRDQMERTGRQFIRDHMPSQHRAFYHKLPFVFLGHIDAHGWPWASILYGEPGFIETPNRKNVVIHAKAITGDPLEEAKTRGKKFGLLGIELSTRRRNRLTTTLSREEEGQLTLDVDQSFGNCPQYIQTRNFEWVEKHEREPNTIHDINVFDTTSRTLIENSDTCFVASYFQSGNKTPSEGADVSHRGGKQGFVRVDDEITLTIPDYSGNFHFNTLGNILETGKAGLLFIDFQNGDLLTLSGRAEILWDSDELEYFEGAHRLWRFRLVRGRFIKNALPMRWTLDSYSPNTMMTGTWKEAEQLRALLNPEPDWLQYKVVWLERESQAVRSIYLSSPDGELTQFEPGQFLTLRVPIGGKLELRSYTLSSASADGIYRISVKRESGSKRNDSRTSVSNYLHDVLKLGDKLEARGPSGTFTLDVSDKRPAVLLAGGIGITPMISMFRHAFAEQKRTGYMRPLTLFAAAHSAAERVFSNELETLQELTENRLNVFWALSKIDKSLKQGRDFHLLGRLTKDFIQSHLPQDDYDFFLCGPPAFMQHCYNLLRELGVADVRIFVEAFGPASLKRQTDHASPAYSKLTPAKEAIVSFQSSDFEQAWADSDGTLLEFALSHGLEPDFACQTGQCGACKVSILDGDVAYKHPPMFPLAEGEALICCAVPAASMDEVPRIVLEL